MVIAGHIIIKPTSSSNQTSSGIYLLEQTVRDPNMGVVLHVGNPRKDMPQEVRVGDKIVYNHKSPRNRPFVLDCEDVIRVDQRDVILIEPINL